MEKEAMEAIKLFRKLDVHYLEVGFLEAMWKVLKIVPEEHLDVVALGLDAIRSTYTRLDIPSEAYVEAYRIYRRGHRDFIDALYYSTASIQKIPLLTIDVSFVELLEKHEYRVDGVVYTPENLEDLLRSAPR
ncbi:MAG: PIN domain-containing protein [Thermofilum sp.]